MEILERSLLFDPITDIQASIVTATTGLYNVMDRDTRFPTVSISKNADGADFVYVVYFSSATVYRTIDRIALLEHNFKEFYVEYVDLSLGWLPFTLTSGAGTSSSSWITNSLTSHYLRCAQVTAAGFRIRAFSTHIANEEKSIGYLYGGVKKYEFPQKPGYSGYSLINKDTSIDHELANGGHRYQTLAHKNVATISLDFVGETMQSSLFDLYYERKELVFVPNPATTTASSWDKQIFPCIWSNGFNFETYSDNSATPYFSGTIELYEVPK